jgi:hypothetical protein
VQRKAKGDALYVTAISTHITSSPGRQHQEGTSNNERDEEEKSEKKARPGKHKSDTCHNGTTISYPKALGWRVTLPGMSREHAKSKFPYAQSASRKRKKKPVESPSETGDIG